MNEVPPSQDQPDVDDDHYRRASALDPSRPSERVRRAVLDHAARLAADRLSENGPTRIGSVNRTWRRPALFGTLAAAALAGLLIAPHYLPPSAPSVTTLSTNPISRPTADVIPAPRAPAMEQSPDANADEAATSASPVEVQNMVEPRASAGNVAPMADPAAEMAAKSAPAKVQNMADPRAPSGNAAPMADSAAEIPTNSAQAKPQSMANAGNAQSATSALAAMSAAPAAASGPEAPAARMTEATAALRRAAEIGDVPELQALLDKQPIIEGRDASGRTALMLATMHGQSGAVDVLLASGADPNAADAHGVTPLRAAVAGDQPAIAAALRRAGAR